MKTDLIEMSIKEIDDHVAEHSATHMKATNGRSVSFCEVYQAAKPVLQFAQYLLLVRPAWQKVIGDFIIGADALCNKTQQLKKGEL